MPRNEKRKHVSDNSTIEATKEETLRTIYSLVGELVTIELEGKKLYGLVKVSCGDSNDIKNLNISIHLTGVPRRIDLTLETVGPYSKLDQPGNHINKIQRVRSIDERERCLTLAFGDLTKEQS